VLGVLAIPPAVFFLQHLFRLGLFVPEGGVVDPRALGAFKMYCIGHDNSCE